MSAVLKRRVLYFVQAPLKSGPPPHLAEMPPKILKSSDSSPFLPKSNANCRSDGSCSCGNNAGVPLCTCERVYVCLCACVYVSVCVYVCVAVVVGVCLS
jgi:hypothetical protein